MAAKKTVRFGRHAELQFFEKSIVFMGQNIYFQRAIEESEYAGITRCMKRVFEEGREHQRSNIEKAWKNLIGSMKYPV